MNKLSLYILILTLLTYSKNLSGQEYPFSLHVNKHYFLVNEDILFSFKASSATLVPEGLPLYVTLMRINENHQQLVLSTKLKWNGQHTDGAIHIKDNMLTGDYVLYVFSSHSLVYNTPLHYCFIYILNPGRYDEEEVKFNIEADSENFSDEDTPSIKSDNDIPFVMETAPGPLNDQEIHTARITPDKSSSTPYYLSVSVVDKRFYDVYQHHFVSKANQVPLEKYLKMWKEKENNSLDSIINASRYIYGRFWINNSPAAIRKVYFYTYKDSIFILSSYITSHDGIFRFEEPEFNDHHPVILFTIPKEGEIYSFELSGRLYSDSTYTINIPDYPLTRKEEFQRYALKKHYIDMSYPLIFQDQLSDFNDQQSLDMESSHEIILDDYIYFPTLPEIIREIIPMVSINYRKGKYQLRVYDSRAKNFCCKENPLIFVNNDLYPDNAEIMNMNTNDIYSIEVIRPVEAIKQFGDIGINGILKINLQPDIVPVSSRKGIAKFEVAGYQKEFRQEEKKLSEEYPDFRSFLYWNGHIRSGQIGEFQFSFQPSKLMSEFIIVITGLSSNGRFIYKTIDYKPTVNK